MVAWFTQDFARMAAGALLLLYGAQAAVLVVRAMLRQPLFPHEVGVEPHP